MQRGNEKIKVSVIMPAYNRAALLPCAIGSVLAQTHRNLELLVIDDGSTDNTSEAVKVFTDRDERVRYFYQKNKGSSSACNLGIRESAGDYVSFLDSDDEWLPGKTEKQLLLFKDNPGTGFVGCNKLVVVTDGRGKVIREFDLYRKKFGRGKKCFSLEDFLRFKSPVNPTSALISKEALLETGFF